MKIKILHILNRLEIGGMENGIVNICNLLDRSKFIPMVCCLRDTYPGPMVDRLTKDVYVYNMGYPEGKAPFSALRLAYFFLKLKPQIVHTHAWGNGCFHGIIGARLAAVPIVINGEHGLQRNEHLLLKKLLFHLCNASLSVSDSLKDVSAKLLNVNEGKIAVIKNGVDTRLFSGRYSKNETFKKLNDEGYHLHEDSFYIICVGSIKYEKSQITLLKAIKLLHDQNVINKLKVLIIGDGQDRKALEDWTIQSGLGDVIKFLGIRSDLPELYSLSDIFVSTSLSKYEGLSNVILEALSSGSPVIATESLGTNELITNNLNGFLIPDNDIVVLAEKIKYLMNNPLERKRLSVNAQEFIKREFSIDKMIQQYETLYLNLLRK